MYRFIHVHVFEGAFHSKYTFHGKSDNDCVATYVMYMYMYIQICTCSASLFKCTYYTYVLVQCTCMYITIHTASLTYIYTCTTQWFKQSALSRAAEEGHTDTVQVLLQRGADVNEQDEVCTY